jgi:hypothetical protein
VLLHVLGHIEVHEGLLVAEHELGQGLGEQRLADAGGAEEDERAHRALGVLQAGAGAADAFGDRLDRVVLADDLLVQLLLEFEQALGLVLLEPLERDAGHLAHDLGDHVLVDGAVDFLGLGAPLLLQLFLLAAALLGLIAELGGLLVVRGLDGLVLGDRQTLDLGLDLGQVRRLGHALDPDAGAGLVDHVDRLVGLHAAGDVPTREFDGRLQRRVGDADAVVLLVAVAKTLQDFNGLLVARRVDGDGLEAAGQGGVLLDVLAVLVEGGGADALDLAAGECGLEHVGRVDRALGAAGADEGVQFVDEEHHVLGPADLVHDGLDAFLELAAVLGAGDHHRQVEHDQALLVEDLGDVAADDALSQALDDGGLADAGFTEQDRVVLGAPAEDLHDAFDLDLAPDDGVEGALASELGEVAAEGVEGGGLALAALGRGAAAAGRGRRAGAGLAAAAGALHALFGALVAGTEEVEDLFADFLELEAEVHEHLSGDAVVLAEKAEQEVLGADVVVIEVAGLFDGVLDDLLGAGSLGQLAHGHHLGPGLDELLDLEADLAQVDIEVLEHVGADAGAFLHEAEQDVLGSDVLVVEALGFLVGQGHDLAGAIGEAFEHLWTPQGEGLFAGSKAQRPTSLFARRGVPLRGNWGDSPGCDASTVSESL